MKRSSSREGSMRLTSVARKSAVLILLFSLTGCTLFRAGNQIPEAVTEPRGPTAEALCSKDLLVKGNILNQRVCDIHLMMQGYRKAIDDIDEEQSILSDITIASVAVATGAVLYDLHSDVLKAAGFGAAGTQIFSDRMNASPKIVLLEAAITRLQCYLGKTQATGATGAAVVFESANMGSAGEIVNSALNTLKSDLRTAYRREMRLHSTTPFDDLLKQYAGKDKTAEGLRIAKELTDGQTSLMGGLGDAHLIAGNNVKPTIIDLENLTKEIAGCSTT